MIKVLTTHDQAYLDYWWSRQMVGPNANHFLYATHTRAPIIEASSWEMIALAHCKKLDFGTGDPDSYLFLHMNRNYPCLTASVILMSDNPLGIRSLIKCAERVARSHGIIYLDASVSEVNKRSLRLTTKFFGEPWGLEPESINYQGQMVGCYRFRRKL